MSEAEKPLKKTHKWGIKRIIVLILAAGILYVIISLLVSRFLLTTVTYKYDAEKITAPVKVVVLTDEHANAFGKDNSRLIKKVQKQNPDLILIVGDAINFYSSDSSFLLKLISDLADTAPIYFSTGNHELAYLSQNGLSIKGLQEDVRRAGGVYLDQSYEDITINGQKLRIGGLYDYVFNNTNVPAEQYAEKGSYLFLQDYSNTDNFKIMLTHRPESYVTDDKDACWPIDLALCGHEHGGQVRLPFIGGFYSSHLGLFSPFLDGYHVINGIPVVISRGLGTYYSKKAPPRFHNPPEIVIVDLS